MTQTVRHIKQDVAFLKCKTFKNERGVPVICKDGLIEVTARGDRDTTSIYAYNDNGDIVGKVNVMSYDKVM